MFRGQFKLNAKEEKSQRDLNIFIIRTYCKAWFNAPCPEKAPKQELDLLCELVNYEKIQPD